ncbi:dTDP-4-dehydrorhamnose 3,5-epimerase [Candidatus Nomurabacteria bacterium RIFCSPLOWO2_01_FULL_39_18]|uniref:dTDP-4-dehydrorhamnose 3,5-epimerase n=1 Tax=Candidatus Nomurabacteria bacterium RIFCSPHIGHO2_01_FULL_40_24b TaxID=1801739 RepID=A0A1F6V7X2_9BACT|nr:MAG: dTDP-4-dehydrorhamnose 3,5-epimerase [Candidatus Nomurabacteria bacterium RIFCSPHIGHO2_01_FULL_40_24b]OGI88918.1 MAG: dTDP-4-dehydrorhamnose 3,5-epimerase [Candidatus Nomurabacteria bacterium RIFCSPLOWO2_01_FULL_39_18]
MKIIPAKIKGVLIIEPDIFEDNRGWFVASYNKKKLSEFGINTEFIQDNHSMSKTKGILRGLHFQNHPFSQAKLVYCTRGAVLDVVVDLRKNSPTYKKWLSTLLSEENKKLLFIPRGFAHGFITLTDNALFQYKVDNDYDKASERSIRFDDPEIGIDWGNANPLLIDRDRNAPLLKDCDINF